VSVYVLVAIVRKRLGLEASLYETLQILSLTMFETTPSHQLLTLDPPSAFLLDVTNQLATWTDTHFHVSAHESDFAK
jgi:hypothetical protein